MKSKYHKPTSIDSAWRDAVARAQVKNFKFHDLRHCCASYMAQAGIPLNVIAEVLGHRKLDMTRRYNHLTTQTKASSAPPTDWPVVTTAALACVTVSLLAAPPATGRAVRQGALKRAIQAFSSSAPGLSG